uniref:Large ribosomal subunit protein uL10 n=1 Tax=Sarcophilus harrisii TaxID=9305 RepID=A0A7N4PXX5_SARHA
MYREDRTIWKFSYFLKIIKLLYDYTKFFIVGADSMGTKQIQQLQLSLSGKSVLLMQKKKKIMMCKAICGHLENNPALNKEDLTEIRDMFLSNKRPAASHVSAISPCNVTVSTQNTDLDPERSPFFQALVITTKISRITNEILSDLLAPSLSPVHVFQFPLCVVFSTRM